MAPFEQGDEFSGSSRQAKELVERLQRAAVRSEEYEKAAEADARFAARQKDQAGEQARGGTARQKAGKLNPEEETDLDAINQKLKQRIALEQDIIANQERIAALEKSAGRRARATPSTGRRSTAVNDFLPATTQGQFIPQSPVRPLDPEYLRYRALLGSGGAGGGLPPRQPPIFFRQPEEPERPQGRLNAGPQRLQLGSGERPALNPGKGASYYEAYEREQQAFSRASAVRKQASFDSDGMAAAEAKLGPAIDHTTEAMRAGNLEFTRFGALSSEWIGAAQRGATTIEELGRQTTATIGKFGGWLAAGSLVFGALDAVRAIGKGAIESASGVNQLERVIKTPSSIDPDKLQRAFRKESQHFNLPIADVSSAVYEVGKVFKTQDEALEASKAVLYSVKVGELDVATASRYLIAIINGFHLPANQLVGVFDQLNAAQNEFGITISDVEAGLAKASGSFNAATTKGSPIQKYHELLALITTAQKATGQTGQVVGTAIQRAPNFLRQSKNKDILKRYGIDAGGDLNDVIVQAFEKSQTLPGHKIAELSSAIFGPQYGARIGTPLFQQYDLYKKVLAGTSPKASKNSGEEELQTQLGSISEKIHEVDTQLESIGSNLAEGGFLNALGLGVEALTEMLSLVNGLLEFFNKLPGPVKDTVSGLLEAKLVLGGLRKFNVGDTLFAGGGSENARRFFNPKNASKIRLNEVLREQESLVRNEILGSSKQGRRLEKDQSGLGDEKVRQGERVSNLTQEGAATEEIVAAKEKMLAIENQIAITTQQQVNAARTTVRGIEELGDVERVKAELAAARSAEEVEAVAARNNYIIPATANKGAALDSAGLAQAIGYKKNSDGTLSEDTIAKAQRDAEIKAAATAEATAAATESETVAATGRIAAARTAVVDSAVTATLVAKESITGMFGAISSMGEGLLAALGGPAGIGIGAALFLVPEAIENLNSSKPTSGPIGALKKFGEENIFGIHAQREEERAAEGARAGKYTRGEHAQYRREEEAARRAAGRTFSEYNNTDKYREAGGYQYGESVEDFAHRKASETYQDQTKGVPTDYKQYAQGFRKLEDAQRTALANTGRASALPKDVLEHQIKAVEELSPSGTQYKKALADVRHNVRASGTATTSKEQAAFIKELRQLEAKGLNASQDITAFYKEYNALSDKLLEARISALSSLVDSGLGSHKDLHQYINAAVFKGVRDLGSDKPGVRAKGAEALDQVSEVVTKPATENLQRELLLAESQSERYSAYDKYFTATRSAGKEQNERFASLRKKLEGEQEKAEEGIAKFKREGRAQGTLKPTQATHGHDLTVGDNTELEDLKELEQLRQERKSSGRRISNLQKAERRVRESLAAIEREQQQQKLTERLGVVGEVGQIREARIGGEHPVAQARAGLAEAQRAKRITEGTKAASPEQERQAVLTVLNARETLRQALKSEAESVASAAEALAVARADGDPVLEALATIRHAEVELSHAKNTAEKDQALADLINGRHKYEQSQVEIAISGIELEGARSQNPATQARNAIDVAKEKLATAHGAAAKNDALRELVEARHAYEAQQVEQALSVINLEESETENPVKQARDQARAARIKLKNAHGKTAKDEAKAEVNNANRNVREKTAEVAIENVEFDASIGKYTTDQQIAAYTRLLHTLKLGRDAKRSLIEKIHSLQEEASGSLELTTGNIALPTLYDIKRAVQGGISGGAVQGGSYNDYSSQTTVNHIHGDQKEIERALDNTQRRNNRAAKRSAGVA